MLLTLCYIFHTCKVYNPIKPIDYPAKAIPLPPPPIENSARLVYDTYYDAGCVQGKGKELEQQNELLLLEKAPRLLSRKYVQYQKNRYWKIYYDDNSTKSNNLEECMID